MSAPQTDLKPTINAMLRQLAPHNCQDAIAMLGACMGHILVFCIENNALDPNDLRAQIEQTMDTIETHVTHTVAQNKLRLALN